MPFALVVLLTVQAQKFHTGGVFKKPSKQKQQAQAMMRVSVPEPLQPVPTARVMVSCPASHTHRVIRCWILLLVPRLCLSCFLSRSLFFLIKLQNWFSLSSRTTASCSLSAVPLPSPISPLSQISASKSSFCPTLPSTPATFRFSCS